MNVHSVACGFNSEVRSRLPPGFKLKHPSGDVRPYFRSNQGSLALNKEGRCLTQVLMHRSPPVQTGFRGICSHAVLAVQRMQRHQRQP